MRRRNSNLIISLLGLSLLSAGLFFLSHYKKQGVDQTLFRLPEDVKIDRVSISKSAELLTLTGSVAGWRVNEKYTADLNRVRLMFAAMDRARPRRRAVDKVADSLILKMKQEGFRVTFSEGNLQILEIFVWESKTDGRTWFASDENKGPAEMTIPGYRTGIVSVFSTAENDWRDRRIFNFNWRNFVSLLAEFPAKTEDNFRISVIDGLLAIEQVQDPDTVNLKNYVDAIQLLESDEIISGGNYRNDSLMASKPVTNITIQEISGKVHELRLFDGGVALIDSTEMVIFGPSRRRILTAGRRTFVRGATGQLPGRDRGRGY